MSNSRIKKSGINVFVAIVQNLLNIVLTFLSRIVFVRILNESYLGINGLFSNVLNILSLADLGVATAMMYSLYGPIARQDTEKICAYIQFFQKIYRMIAGTVFILGVALIPFLPKIVRLDTPIEHITWYYLIALLNIVISYLFVYRTTLMAADQKSFILNNYIMIFKIITFLVQLFILICTKDYLLYLLAALIINFFSNFVQNKATLREYPYLKENKKRDLLNEDKQEIYTNVKALFVYKVAAAINGDIDSILISIMVGTVAVGYYSNYIAIIGSVVSLITAVFTAVKASVGNLIADDNKSKEDELQTYQLLEFINHWMVGFCAISFCCLFNDCIQLFFGKEYVLPMTTVIVMVANFYTCNVFQCIWVFRETTGYFVKAKYIMVVHSILNVFFSLIFGKWFGMAGIIGATVIARLLFSTWREPCLFFREYLGVSPKGFFENYIKWVFIVVITGSFTWWLCSLLHITSVWLNFGCKLLLCTILPNLIFLLILFPTKQFRKLTGMLMKPWLSKIKNGFDFIFIKGE